MSALQQVGEHCHHHIECYALHDLQEDLPKGRSISFGTAGGNRFIFMSKAIRMALGADLVILGHLNMSFPLIFIFRLLSLIKRKRLILITHGIEAWKKGTAAMEMSWQQYDTILTVSNYTRDRILQAHQVPEECVQVFPNTLDPLVKLWPTGKKDMDLMAKYGILETDKVLFTVCRVATSEKEKGYDKVIRSMPEILTVMPTVKYLLVGKTEDKERARLQQIIEEEQLSGKVIFTGYISDESLNAYYQLGDVFIMPSKKEGFGIVFLEALASGKPVIGGNVDGTVDALMGGGLGMLVNPDSIYDIQHAVLGYFQGAWPQHLYDADVLREKTIASFGFEEFKNRLQKIINA